MRRTHDTIEAGPTALGSDRSERTWNRATRSRALAWGRTDAPDGVDAGRSPADDGGAGGVGGRRPWLSGGWWLLWLPLPLALGVELAVRLGVPGAVPGDGPTLLTTGLYATTFLVALSGTVRLFEDARRLARSAEWRPRPWYYVLGAAVGLTALISLRAGIPAGRPEAVPATLGAFVVATLVSSIFAGPAYLLRRWRRQGLD